MCRRFLIPFLHNCNDLKNRKITSSREIPGSNSPIEIRSVCYYHYEISKKKNIHKTMIMYIVHLFKSKFQSDLCAMLNKALRKILISLSSAAPMMVIPLMTQSLKTTKMK